MSLFGLTPEQVRANARYQNRADASRFGGWGMLGNKLGTLFGTKDTGQAEAQKQSMIYSIRDKVVASPGFKELQPQEKINALVGAYMNAGEIDIAMGIQQKGQAMMPQADFTEFTKEERGRASKSVKAIDDRAATIRGSYGKLEKLAERAKASPENSLARRASINSMIANVVRLNSPGIVSETELKTYTGGQGTTAAMLSFLEGKGVNIDAWKASIDPSGAASPDDLLGIGRSLILGEAPPLFDQYEDAKSRATRAKISKRAYTTNFGEGANKNLEALRGLATPDTVPEGVDPADWEYMTPEERALF